MSNVIKQLEEKNVKNEITHMVWSSRMDLVALANNRGEVALHRLTWTRAWILNPPKEGVLVKGICWRPDGKILAIAYSTGEVHLVGIENKNILNVSNVNGDITYISWVQEKLENKVQKTSNLLDQDINEDNDYMKNVDFSSIFLPQPTPLPTSNGEESKNFLHIQSALNMILIGTKDGFVHIQIFGCFTCAVLNISEKVLYACSIKNIHITEDLDKLFVTVRNNENNTISIVIYDSQIFQTHTKELYTISMKSVYLLDLITYLNNAITSIAESWESILIEIDNKLSKYASLVPQGGVTADFLDLLMFGICSQEMEMFLLYDITKKGLEKFGQTIEMSYVNIQKLLLKNVTKFGQSITYHLAELRGMARFEHRYKVLGLDELSINKAIQDNGSFLIKTGEMQQIINHSLSNYRAFFRWIYTAIMHLIDEPIPTDIHKMTQQDLAYITEFLQNFDHIGYLPKDEVQKGFIMERIGQYLHDNNLTIPPCMEGNDWTVFLRQNECLQRHPGMLKHYENLSLMQQFKMLKTSLEEVLNSPKETIKNNFGFLRSLDGFNFGESQLKMSTVNMTKDSYLFSFVKPKNYIYLLQIFDLGCYAQCGKFYFTTLESEDPDCDNFYEIVDNAFFSHNILSLLLQNNSNNKSGVLYQFNVEEALEKLTEIDVNSEEIEDAHYFPEVNGTFLAPKSFKNIDNFVCCQFAISGTRKVGIVLSENRKKIRLFELSNEDDDDDDEAEITNSTLKESDVSMQDASFV
ncbi:unnamed protein product [Brassicogethes aeneus]|uniref:Anaphase-promoting complex subunit 4 n=1 Tax=Brassicogethes aeneus TaxID=1431903 RepID=A0A9P0FLB6_BRAAE|nr:unnamed protein product [Brassicogethes aeneus]